MPRYLRLSLPERLDNEGNVLLPLDIAAVRALIPTLQRERVESIAVGLLHAFVNPAHELALKDIVQRRAPRLPLSVSCEVLPEIKEYERTSTTTIDAYVKPIVATYLHALRAGLDAAGIPARLLLIGHNPGLHELSLALSDGRGDAAAHQALAGNLPTSGLVVFDFAVDGWPEVAFRRGRLVSFTSPKSLKQED